MSAAMDTGARDRSRSPLRIQALSEQARAALDVVCKRDEPDRVAEQRTVINQLRTANLQQAVQIQQLKAEIESDRSWFLKGKGLFMGPIWREHKAMHPELVMDACGGFYASQTLHGFLHQVTAKIQKLQKMQETFASEFFDVVTDFPVEAVEPATEEEEEEAEEDEEEAEEEDEAAE